MHKSLVALASCLVLLCVTPSTRVAVAQAPADPSLLTNLTWRSIGPAGASGRIVDIAVVGDFPHRVYVAAATGGLWKTDNNGLTWEPLFDREATNSIGDVAAISAAPDTVWVGTGEANVRNSVSWGDGIYKSTDAGATWKNMGLRDSHHIGRIVIDPRNPDVVYAAAAGHLWGPNKERGVFKTTDGGATWTSSLFIDENTGVIDLAMDPHDSSTLYAATFQRRQTFPGGPPAQVTGPGSGLYKTSDAGRTWRKLTKGLPTVAMGRIGIDVSLSNPSVIYAIIQTASAPRAGGDDEEGDAPRPGAGAPRGPDGGGVFRSADRGETWTWVNPANNRPEYYSQLRVDPTNENRVFMLDQNVSLSLDGGRTFQTLRINVHVDHHAMWIDPKNPKQMVLGNDGGVYFSYDGGVNWDFQDHMAISQFYAVDVDMRKPYYVYGGTQDYCSWGGPSATRAQIGITTADWFKVQTGDGFQVRVDPTDYTILYAESQNGGMIRHDLKSGRNTSIRPVPPRGQPAYRFNWETPILISPHDPATLYVAANVVFKSTNRGNGWTVISSELPSSSGGTITTVAESPMRAGVLYAGTDDGRVHVTRDGGKAWADLTGKFPGLAGPRWVSRLIASRFDEGTAYATFDGHRNDDFAPHVYKTTDFGATWRPIHSNLPAFGPVRVIREDYKNRNLLFAGTEFAAFVSIDGGRSWQRLMNGLPTVAIADVVVHPRDGDLVAGTHGRSFYILDISPLQQLTDAVLTSPAHLFAVKPAMAFDPKVFSDDQFLAQGRWVVENPPVGATIYYYLASDATSDVTVTIEDKAGRTVQQVTGSKTKGLNKVLWNLRTTPVRLTRRPPAGGGGGGGGGGQGGAPQGSLVDPGDYIAVLRAGGRELRTPITVEVDPLLQISDAQRTERRTSVDRLVDLQKQADAAAASADRTNAQVLALSKPALAFKGINAALKTQVEAAVKEAASLAQKLGQVTQRVNAIYRDVINSPFVPTDTQTREAADLAEDLRTASASLDQLASKTIPALETEMNKANVPRTGGQ